MSHMPLGIYGNALYLSFIGNRGGVRGTGARLGQYKVESIYIYR